MKTRIFLMLALCLSVAEARDVYRWIGPDGSVNYSDEPRAGADRITLPEWVPPKIIRPMAPPLSRTADKPRPVVYEQLAIASPAPEENIRDNQGNVGVSVTLSPELVIDKDHRIQLLLDGQPKGEPAQSLEQQLQGVERGEHTVAAQVLDGNDQVLITSEPVVFYLKDYSPLFYPPVVPPPPGDGPPDQAERAPMADPGDRADHTPFRPYKPPPPPPPGSGTP